MKALCIATFLHALAQVETGDDDTLIGAAGERSRYQITEAAWETVSGKNTHWLCYGSNADRAAELLVRGLCAKLHTQDPLTIASAWNQGILGHRAHGPNDHAQRVTALYYECLTETTKRINTP